MKVLIVKTSSLGDVVHALPAVDDLSSHCDGIEIDWVAEEPFVPIVRRHPGVARVIPSAVRSWRRDWIAAVPRIRAFTRDLRRDAYDLVIDSQGLVKSAIIAALARGPVAGFDRASCREPIASRFYARCAGVPTDWHAVTRQRALFGALFGYEPSGEPSYGLRRGVPVARRVMLIHGTTWTSKHWPIEYWVEVARLIAAAGRDVVIPAGSAEERERAGVIASQGAGRVLPSGTLGDVADELAACEGAIAVDTGLAHIATALGVPLVTLYGPTDPRLTGTFGPFQHNIVSDHLPCIPCKKRNCGYPVESSRIYPPCFEPITPESVWRALQRQLDKTTQPGA